MIVKISDSYVKSTAAPLLSEQVCSLLENGHYIKCSAKGLEVIKKAVSVHASTLQKSLLRFASSLFCPSLQQQMFMRKVDLDSFHLEGTDFKDLFGSSSYIMLENGAYEWPFYQSIIHLYSNDRKYKNLFQLISKAVSLHQLRPMHAGGYTQMIQLLEMKESVYSNEICHCKLMVVFDRDTDDSQSFDPQKDKLFFHLCGKTSLELNDQDVYSLSQPGYVWHCLYKREIENYFPNRVYIDENVDMSKVPLTYPERDYYKINGTNCGNYGKAMVSKFPPKMTRQEYEDHMEFFDMGGEKVSEFQLILLKMLKII